MLPAMNSLGFDKPPAATRVVVAMSGGVDSSVVAAQLAEQGYDVVGITLQLYDHGIAIQRKGACCAGADIYDARTVADRIGFPHYVLDYESRFGQAVMDDFADSYLRGETPIPCIRCNQKVKFRDLMETARDLGADCLATGHYVRRVEGPQGPELHRAVDPAKDQSYFLFATTPEQLAFLRFPLGGNSKAETRAEAARLGLVVADKPDSQDICFVPEGRYGEVVARLRPGAVGPGEIVHLDGTVLGRHQGIVHYTIGQRKGLGIGGRKSNDDPLYVVRLDPEARRVIVGPWSALARHSVALTELNWLDRAPGPEGRMVEAKLRSAQSPVPATVRLTGAGEAVLELHAPQHGVAPGQAAVLYDGDRVLGGGFIARAERAAA
ncbi:thiouridylase [Inquilinus limosus MP06]|uniref:tRNA-specific 2-thiouridylase MnmA n=2 Tax=Inquilinus limosus TaxID=171674 RepID=A0A0A0D6S2_9PROT|nr:thiouridylase [Inquilinus limosus MP06]